ncbi:hypothetical protein MCEMSE6_01476 [Oxalobacteraceae bacterium]
MCGFQVGEGGTTVSREEITGNANALPVKN